MRTRIVLITTSLVIAPVTGHAVAPDVRSDQVLLAQAGAVSLDQAVAKVRRLSGGKVVGADSIEQDGTAVYRIKVVFPDGRVKIYFVDPATGDIQG